MSTGQKVSSATASGAISVPTRVVTGGRGSMADRIEGVSGAAALRFSGDWHPANDDGFAQGGSAGSGRGQSQPQFTPLVGRLASAFAASQSYSDTLPSSVLFGSDLQRAVGTYEFNMHLFAGTKAPQGSIVNRLS